MMKKILAILTIGAVAMLTACSNGGGGGGTPAKETKTVTREFTIAVPGHNSIKVKDMRSGADDKTLEELGIITKIKNALPATSNSDFTTVLARNLTIQIGNVDGGMDTPSGNRLDIDFATLLSVSNDDLKGVLPGVFSTMCTL